MAKVRSDGKFFVLLRLQKAHVYLVEPI